MKVLGVTGGVGMGKSATAKFLREQHLPVVDTDDLARQVVAPGEPALREVVTEFGENILDAQGQLRRDELARIVFADDGARKKLEAILHPRIRDLWRAQVAAWRTEGHQMGFVVIPLLYETGAENELDAVVCVACSSRTQAERLRERGWSDVEISRRIASQLPVSEKISRANYVIWTEGTMDLHARQLSRILGGL